MDKQKEIILGYLNWLAKRLGPSMATQLNGADVDEYLEQQVKYVDLADVGEPLPTDFADWMGDNEIYKSIEGWEFEGGCYETDELYSEFLKSYSKWKANR